MRVLIAFLLLLNLLLYLLGRIMPSEPVAAQVALPDIGNLRLWSELPEVNPERAEVDAKVLLNDGEDARSAFLPALTPKAEPSLARLPDADGAEFAAPSAGNVAMMAALDEPDQEQAKPELTQAAGTEEIEGFAYVGSVEEPLIDITKQSAGTADAEARRAALRRGLKGGEQVVIESADSDLVCGQLRWYGDVEAAKASAARLKSLGMWAELINDPVAQRNGYWVLIPPQANRAAALAKRSELRAMGVEDLWLFRQGPLLNSISVGLFSGKRRAQRRAEEIRILGFEVEVRPKLKITERFAVTYRTDQRSAHSLFETRALAASLENRSVPCP